MLREWYAARMPARKTREIRLECLYGAVFDPQTGDSSSRRNLGRQGPRDLARTGGEASPWLYLRRCFGGISRCGSAGSRDARAKHEDSASGQASRASKNRGPQGCCRQVCEHCGAATAGWSPSFKEECGPGGPLGAVSQVEAGVCCLHGTAADGAAAGGHAHRCCLRRGYGLCACTYR